MKTKTLSLSLLLVLPSLADAMDRDLAISLARMTAASVGGQVYTVSDTGSMEPTLNSHSIIVAEPICITKVQTGDMVVFRNEKRVPVVHRVVKTEGDGLVVKGDANERPDAGRVTKDALLGKVCAAF